MSNKDKENYSAHDVLRLTKAYEILEEANPNIANFVINLFASAETTPEEVKLLRLKETRNEAIDDETQFQLDTLGRRLSLAITLTLLQMGSGNAFFAPLVE